MKDLLYESKTYVDNVNEKRKKMSAEVQNIVVRKAKTGEGNGRGAVCRQGGISSAMGKNVAGNFEVGKCPHSIYRNARR